MTRCKPYMRNSSLACAAGLWLAACGADAPEPAVVHQLRISIDAANNCSMEGKPVECTQVAAAIKARYPTSSPRVDICLDKQSRYEAAAEVMQSVTDAGLTVGDFDCGTKQAG